MYLLKTAEILEIAFSELDDCFDKQVASKLIRRKLAIEEESSNYLCRTNTIA